MAPLLTCSTCNTLHPKTSYSKSQWALGAGSARCSRCIYMETNDVVDFDSQVVQEDENVPLTPPGPEMRKILEGGVVTAAAADVGSVEEEKEEIDMGEGMNLGDNNYLKEEAKEEEEEMEAQGNEVVDQDSNDYIAPAIIPAVLSSSDHPIAVYEDEENVDNDDDVIAPPPPDDEAVNISSGWESSEGETSSEEEETESSAEEHTDESNDDDEEEDAAPYVAAAAGGAAAAAAAASANEEETHVEMGSNEPTETDAAGDNPPESSPEEDFVTPEDEETGEQFNLANEESRNQVLPPQDDNDDEEQQLILAAAGTLAVTENSVENDDPSFASAAVATKAADTITNDDEEHRVSRKSSSCCKRHKCLTLFIILMILFVIAAVVLIILFLIGPLKHPVSQEESPLEKKGTATGLCTVVDLGPFYQTDCETCLHTVAMDAETGLIARGGGAAEDDDDSIHFIVNDGTYIPGQTLPFTTHEVSALLGNYAALGDPNAFGLGTVYVYEKIAGAWSDVWNMTPDKLGAKFGTAIALDADKMVVGAPGDVNESSTGSVYVYGRGGDGNWVEEGKLYQTSVPTGNFGSGVALRGDTLVVADATFPGTVYVYQYDSTANSWDQRINGTLSSADCSSTFGISVGVTNSGGVLVECPKEKGGEGAVYYYTPTSDGSGYELRQKITAFNEEPLPELGKKIVVDKGRLLVTTAAESVYVYELGDGTFTEWGGGEWEEAALIAAPGGANDAALSGEHIFVSYGGNTHSYILEC